MPLTLLFEVTDTAFCSNALMNKKIISYTTTQEALRGGLILLLEKKKGKKRKRAFDAMIPSNGHITTNICICCYKCNSIKSSQTDTEFKC